MFGEISGSALAGIEAALSRFLKPLLSGSDGWGKANSEQKVRTGLPVLHFNGRSVLTAAEVSFVASAASAMRYASSSIFSTVLDLGLELIFEEVNTNS